jgi:hypothetical protein
MSAEANGLRGLLMTSSPDLVSRRCRVGGTPLKLSGRLVLYCGLDDMRANFRSKLEDTGGEPGVRVILLKPPVIGMLLDIFDLNLDSDRVFGMGVERGGIGLRIGRRKF